MKQLLKISLPNALQVMAVLIIFFFGYPGCSSNKELKAKVVNVNSQIMLSDSVSTSK